MNNRKLPQQSLISTGIPNTKIVIQNSIYNQFTRVSFIQYVVSNALLPLHLPSSGNTMSK